MKRKPIYKLEFKIILSIIRTFIYSILTMAVLYIIWKMFLILFIEKQKYFVDEIYSLRQNVNFHTAKCVIWMLIFIFYCHLFLYKKLKYFIEINEYMKVISDCTLDQKIPENHKEELGKLAQNINEIIERLNKSIEEERRAEQTKYDLITNVSHDLRTPLTSILGYLELIDRDKYKDEVELRHYVNIAYEKSKRLNVLINDLFEYTIMRNNTVKLKKQEINIVELLNQVILEFRLQLRNKNMKCRTYFSEDKFLVNGDAMKLARSFENLISNGMKYGYETEYIDVVTRKEDSYVVIEVINYGEPIPNIDLPFVFERFYRVEKSRSQFTGGSGLGLAITKSIIELHEGKIFVESNYDRTVFIIKLPLDIKQ